MRKILKTIVVVFALFAIPIVAMVIGTFFHIKIIYIFSVALSFVASLFGMFCFDKIIQKKKTILLSCRIKVMRDGIICKKGMEGVVRVIVPLELGHGDLVGVDFETPSGKFFDWVRSKDLKVIKSRYIQIF